MVVVLIGIINNGVLIVLNLKNLGGLVEFLFKVSIVKYIDKLIGLLNDV